MFDQLKRWLAPPVFADDDQTRRAELLNAMLWTMLVAGLLTSPLVFTGPTGTFTSRLVTVAAVILMVAGLSWVLRRGRVALASALAVAGLWIIVTTAITFGGGGVRSLGFPSYLLLVMIAGLLLGKRVGTAFAALAVLIGLGFILAQTTGRLVQPVRPDTDLEVWIVEAVFLLSTAALLHIALGSIERALGRARQELAERQRAEHFLRLVVDTSPNMIFVTDQHGQALFANQYTADYYGTTPEVLLSKTIDQVHLTPAEAQVFVNDDLEVIRSGRKLVKDELNTAPNGAQHWFHTVKVPLARADGTLDALGIAIDITERVQRERELEIIVTLSAALRAAETIPEMQVVLLQQILSLLAVAAATVELVEPQTGDALVTQAYGPWEAMLGQRIRYGTGLNSYIQATGQPYINNNVTSDPRVLAPELYHGYHAAAGVPMTAQGQFVGFLWIGQPNDVRAGDVRLLLAMADIAANAIRRALLHAQTEERARRLAALHEIDRDITSSRDRAATLDLLAGHVVSQLQVQAATIRLLNPAGGLVPAAARGPNAAAAAQASLAAAHTALVERRLLSLPDLSQPTPLWAATLAAAGLGAYFAAPLLARGQALGVLELFHNAPLKPDAEWLNFLNTLAGQAAVAIENSALIANLQRSNTDLQVAYDATIEGWSRALELRDHETEGHTQRVAELTLRLARAMGLNAEERVHIRRGALLHDMGKLGIPDHILLKPADLTPDEWTVMRLHPGYAYQMLEPIDYLRPVLDIPWAHHEKWDGSGYPRELAGEQIPLAARLFAVVDVWDALRSDRPYRPAWPVERVLAHLREQSGKHFDPAVVRAFLALDLGAA